MTTHTTEIVEIVETETTETYRELREGSVPVYGITVPGVTVTADIAVYAREMPDGTVAYDVSVVYDDDYGLIEAIRDDADAHAAVVAAIREAMPPR